MTKKASSGKPRLFGIGDDGRRIWTKDTAARASHRSATNKRSAGTFNGREVHVGVAVPALRGTDTTSWCTFGPDVPPVAVIATLVPAGFHPGDAVVDEMIEARQLGLCEDAIVDPGYSLKRPESFAIPLAQAGIAATDRPASNQKGDGGRIGAERVLDGQLFSQWVPGQYLDLKLPGRNATQAERAESMRLHAARAVYRFGRHKAPGGDGTTRWRCPVHQGRLRAKSEPKSMRQSKDKPLVHIPNGAHCCEGVLTLGANELPLMQPTIVGTPAWHAAYGRRNLAETFNSFMHGGFVDIDKGYVCLLEAPGREGRIDILVAHTIAGANRWVSKNWNRIRAQLSDDKDREPARTTTRKPRRDRAARFEDLPKRGNDPPT